MMEMITGFGGAHTAIVIAGQPPKVYSCTIDGCTICGKPSVRDQALTILREHLAPWMVGEQNTDLLPADEFDCCVDALFNAGLLR